MATPKRTPNPLAFPRPIGWNGAEHYEDREINYSQDGMTLRDWFAGKALAGLLANPNANTVGSVTRRAFDLADAMLERREEAQ